MDPVTRIRLRFFAGCFVVLLVIVLFLRILAWGGTPVPRPKDPPGDHYAGSRHGNCDGVFVEKRGYGYPASNTLYMAVFLYKDQAILWYIDEPPYGEEFDYVVVAFPGGGYERMSFEEARVRFPTVCDVPLIKGGTS